MSFFIKKYVFGGAVKTMSAPYILIALLAFILGTMVYYTVLFGGHYLNIRILMNAALLLSFIALERSPLSSRTLSFLSPIVLTSILTFGVVYFNGDFLVFFFSLGGALFALTYMHPKGVLIYILFNTAVNGLLMFGFGLNIMGPNFTTGQLYGAFVTSAGLNVIVFAFSNKFTKILRVKEQFLTNISHEMRTPLNAILGFAELSLDNDAMSDNLRTNLSDIRTSGMTLLSIVNDLLDISKIETGMFRLNPGEYETAVMVNTAITQSILYKGNKPIKFDLVIEENFPAKLCGDELRVRIILSNILSNAFKYTEKGTIRLTLQHKVQGDGVRIVASILDTGKGILASQLGQIFEDFVQVNVPTRRRILGTGLGLSIARRLARMMDGDITVVSKVDKGSLFTARFRQQWLSADVVSPEVVDEIQNFRFSEQEIARLKPLSLPHVHILVVDDVATNLAVAEGMLQRYDITAHCVTSGADAVQAVLNQEVRYDAIFMDHLMPGMDGVETARRIREIEPCYAGAFPIIMVSANALAGNEAFFLSNGFQAFLSKPIDLFRLDAVIKEWVCNKAPAPVEPRGQTPNKSFTPPASVFDTAVEGINFAEGLKRFNGDTRVYFGILRVFAQNTPSMLATADAAVETDWNRYIVTVHGLKSSCYSIRANEAGVLAEALETAGKTQQYDYIKQHHGAFTAVVQTLLTGLTDFLTNANAQATDGIPKAGQTDKPDRETLARLLEACNQHDLNEIESLMQQLCAYTYAVDNDFVLWLRKMSDEMNYEEIAEQLAYRLA